MTNKKRKIIGGIIGGITYAMVMAGFDYLDNKDFSITKFILSLILFGLFMSFWIVYNAGKTKQKNNK
ncbi:MAG: hypothetical protein HRT66_06110 [Flavobacteriaceae bacterium]|nr:hypothetical protein [Flavobacteriaceae bacterium]